MKESSIQAKKKFGQNFLQDETVLVKIIESMPNTPNKVVEIGPGLGDLTKFLVNVKSVEAFEVDTDLCALLQKKFSKELSTKQLQLHCGDVLKTWKSTLYDEPYDLVANLPYYIATNIILKALADTNCKNILVMVQLEVAKKFCASPSEKEFGSLSVIAQSVATATLTQVVPPSSFDPMPKVDSAVMLLEKHSDRVADGFEEFLKVGFKQPRKTLAKNLQQHYEKVLVQDVFNTLGFPSNIRPHQLSTNDYHQLYRLLTK